jgi:hypothetical protein
MNVVETQIGLVDLGVLFGITVHRDELTLRLDPSPIYVSGPGLHRTLCDFLYEAPPALKPGVVKCVFDPSVPLAVIEKIKRTASDFPGLGRALAWPIPADWLLLEGKKASWLWPRALFRQLAYSRRRDDAFHLAIGPAFYRIEAAPGQAPRLREELHRFFPRSSTELTATDRNAFTVWPEHSYAGMLVRPRFAANKIEEIAGFDPAVWNDPAIELIRGGPSVLEAPRRPEIPSISP